MSHHENVSATHGGQNADADASRLSSSHQENLSVHESVSATDDGQNVDSVGLTSFTSVYENVSAMPDGQKDPGEDG